MKKIPIILLCFVLAGCISTPKTKTLKLQAIDLQESLSKKDVEIMRLQGLLSEKEQQLKEKDLKIEELKKKLAGFGAF